THLLAHPLPRLAAAGSRLPRGVPVPGASGPTADRRRRPPSRRAVPRSSRDALRIAPRRLLGAPESLLVRRLRSLPRRDGRGRHRAVAPRAGRLGERDRDGPPLGPLPLLRAHRPGLVRVRLGDPAPRDRLPRHLPLPAARPAALSPPSGADAGRVAAPLARLPHHARGRADQAARRPLLARLHVPLLPLRDPAAPESPQPRAPLPAPRVSPDRGALQSPERARRALVHLRSAPLAARGRLAAARLSDLPHPERQPVVPQLADDRPHPRVLRRLMAPPRAAQGAGRAGRARGGDGAALPGAAGRRR